MKYRCVKILSPGLLSSLQPTTRPVIRTNLIRLRITCDREKLCCRVGVLRAPEVNSSARLKWEEQMSTSAVKGAIIPISPVADLNAVACRELTTFSTPVRGSLTVVESGIDLPFSI